MKTEKTVYPFSAASVDAASEKTQQFSPDAKKVYDALSAVPQSIEEICALTKLPVQTVNGILLEFELEELVLQDFGRRYAKL